MIIAAKTAARLYVPLGTRMSLGDYVRVTRTFTEAFKAAAAVHDEDAGPEDKSRIKEDEEITKLRKDLKVYIYYTLIRLLAKYCITGVSR